MDRGSWIRRDPRVVVRTLLGLLLLANLAMAALVFRPWEGSAEDRRRQVLGLRKQVRDRQAALEKLKGVAAKIDAARAAGDKFLQGYFMNRRTASSTIVAELQEVAQKAGIKQKEVSFVFEPIEGSETLSVMSVTANYEGTFADLMQFVNLLDRSEKFLIVDSLQAAPQQGALQLSVSMKLHGFIQEAP